MLQTPPATSKTVTFLLSSIENSRLLWEKHRQLIPEMLGHFDRILRDTVKTYGGTYISDGREEFTTVFGDTLSAVRAAKDIQLAVASQDWSSLEQPLGVGMAIHCAEIDCDIQQLQLQDFRKPRAGLDKAHQILQIAQGGQILLSRAAHTSLQQHQHQHQQHQEAEHPSQAQSDFELQPLGEQRLLDLFTTEIVYGVKYNSGNEATTTQLPPKSLNNWASNLPQQNTLFVGREQELGQAVSLIRKSEVRLLTFTGPGGTGKTRLSTHLAAELLHEFEDGVFLVELAALTQSSQVLTAISHVLNLKETCGSGREQLENLKEFLSTRRILLVFDNFEQVTEAASLVADLLGAAPLLKVLVSSRTLLKIYGEQEFPVNPLGLPDLRNLPASVADLNRYSAIRLFVERASRVKPGYKLDSQSGPVIARICERLDGLPLAIELAAAHMKMYQPEVILESLQNQLDMPVSVTSDSTLPVRHQTLRTTIEWSYNLLTDSEKTFFGRLSVFAGGCTTEEAEEICNPEGDPDLDAMDCITNLLDKSLLQLQIGLSSNSKNNSEPRFKMLQTIQDYSREKLGEAGELEEYEQRYLDYFLALAQEGEPHFTGPQQAVWFNRFDQEYKNIQAIMNMSVVGDRARVDTGLQMSAALWRLWLARGYYGQGRHWMESLLLKSTQLPQQQQQPSSSDNNKPALILKGRVFNGAGILAREQGDLSRAQSLLQQSLELYRRAGDKAGTATALNSLGTVAAYLGQYEEAISYHEQTLALHREFRDARGIAISLGSLGALYTALGNYEQALKNTQEAHSLLRRQGDRMMSSVLVHNLAFLWLVQGQTERAKGLAKESLAIRQEIEDQGGVAESKVLLAEIERTLGNFKAAFQLYSESLDILEEIEDGVSLATCFEGLAATLVADEPFSRSLSNAALLYGAASIIRERNSAPLQPVELAGYEKYLILLKTKLTPELFELNWSVGSELSQQKAIEIAKETLSESLKQMALS